MRRLLSFLTLAALLFGVAVPAAGQTSSPKLYVCNQGEATVSVIDMKSKTVETTVDLKERGFSENAKPHHVVAEPDGSHWYVTLIGANTILKFNADNEIVDRLNNFEVPGLLSLDPKKDLLYAGRSMSAVNPPKSMGFIQRSNMEVVERVNTFFPRPHPIAVKPNGKYVFIASLATNQLMGIDTETRETKLTRLGGTTQTPVQFAITADGSRLIAGGQKTGELLIFDATNAPALSVVDTLDVGKQPWHPVIDRHSGLAYVPNKMSHSVSVVDVDNATVQATIRGDGLAQPHGTALTADGEYLFVSNNNRKGTYAPSGENGTVTVIDTDTNEIVKIIEVGTYPTGIGTYGGQQVAAQ
ncbi:MAG: YncE family protein [Salinibacter sp.]